MALNVASVERITCCACSIIMAEDGTWFVEACRDGVPVALGQGKDIKEALAEVVQTVYRANSRQAMEDGEWRCQRCGRLGPLQAHHVVHRARGARQDDPQGLSGLCSACHQREHGG